MGIARRLALMFRVKAHKYVDRAQDPFAAMDYSYRRQLEILDGVHRKLADVAGGRERIEFQRAQLRRSADRLELQAAEAARAGQDTAAREALTRRSEALAERSALDPEVLAAEEQNLTAAAQRLQAKIVAFRARQESIAATCPRSAAQSHINEAICGIAEEIGDVRLVLRRAEDRTAWLRSRSQLVDMLLSSGVFDDPSLPIEAIQPRSRRVRVRSEGGERS